jgi:hypothetical protein
MANMELIEAKTLSSNTTTVSFTSIPSTYTDLKVLVSARSTRGSDAENIYIGFNTSTSSFTMKQIIGEGSGTPASYSLDRLIGVLNGATAIANTFNNLEINIPNYTSSNNKSFSAYAVQEANQTLAYSQLTAGLWSNSAAINSIEFTVQFTQIAAGSTFYLYGISNVTSGTKATGGVVSSDGTYYYHMFPFSGTFTPTQNITADYLVIAGGGGSANPYINASDVGGGGGGAGGLRSTVTATGGGGSLESALSLTANTAYTVTVGAGGAGNSGVDQGGQGGNSSIAGSGLTTVTSTGGGGGARQSRVGAAGGSGGGGSTNNAGGAASPAGQGFAGGQQPGSSGGGGGGAGAVGANGSGSYIAGNGGVGVQITALATPTQTGVNNGYYAGGGGGGGQSTFGIGGLGGGANGSQNTTGNNAIANTGGGAGGIVGDATGKNGGSGLVIIRYTA